MRPPSPSSAPATPGYLRGAFGFAVAAFAWWRFSDNTADNDLWGHVLYGQRMLSLGHVEKVDPFSWTAAGAPWINHEVLAEAAMGWVHRVAGGTGLWLLALAVAAVTLGLALRRPGAEAREPGLGLTQVALLAASTNAIALGFSVRPQLFTMFALVVLLHQMRAIAAGHRAPLFFLPGLFLIWINTHGGVLAGLLLLALAGLVSLGQRLAPGLTRRWCFAPPRNLWRRFGLALLLCTLAALVTPWGPESLRWLFQSVSYTRPEITEWRPTPFDFAHAAFWIVASVSIVAWLASRRPRAAWEAAVLSALLFMAARHQRHVPLFALANLVLTPVHLLDLLRRLAARAPGLRHAVASRAGSGIAATALCLAGGAALAASIGAPKQRPWTIEVERDRYPCAALAFLHEHPLSGRLLVFFDWGQQAMWELPRNRVSFDGRLDTVYPRPVIDAHWRLYAGGEPDPAVLDLDAADFALVPSGGGAERRLRMHGWTLAYADPLAAVLVRAPGAQPVLRGVRLPVLRERDAVAGREPFPSRPSALSQTAE